MLSSSRQTNKFNGRKYRSHGRCCFYHPKLLRGSILLPNSGTKPDDLTNTALGRTVCVTESPESPSADSRGRSDVALS